MSSSSKLRVKQSRTFEKKNQSLELFSIVRITPKIKIHFQYVMTCEIKVNWSTFCPAPDWSLSII